MGGGHPGPGAGQGFSSAHQSWNFQSSIDPEELFRKIFGQQARYGGGGFQEDFAESAFGFGAAQEVHYNTWCSSKFFTSAFINLAFRSP